MEEFILKNKKDIKRVKTYIEGIDENIQGGIPENHVVLLSGTSGTMKSSVAFNIAYNEALRGQVSLYLTLEQSQYSLLKHMVNMDFDLSKINLAILSDISKIDEAIKGFKGNKGGLIMADLSSIRKKVKDTKFTSGGDWLNAIKNLTKKAQEGANCSIFVLDSMSALYVLSQFDDPRSKLFFIFEFLRDLGLTSFLISEIPASKNMFSEFGVEEYLADGIIHLQLTERYRKVTREISVVKMRATDCNNDIFTLEFKDRKFRALYGGKTPVI
ncbi:MAG: ATPase domain-containing protein [Nanoarchaeota archaeon]